MIYHVWKVLYLYMPYAGKKYAEDEGLGLHYLLVANSSGNKWFIITINKLSKYTLYFDYTILTLLIFSQINVLTAEQVF